MSDLPNPNRADDGKFTTAGSEPLSSRVYSARLPLSIANYLDALPQKERKNAIKEGICNHVRQMMERDRQPEENKET